MAEVGGSGIMQTYQWKQVPTKEMEMTGMWEGAWLLPVCLISVCGWWCTEGNNTEVAVWKQMTIQVSRSVKWCLCELHLILCSALGAIPLWLRLEWSKMWYFCSPAAPPLSCWSNVGREQEGSETCLSSSADLLCNPCHSLWAFALQALLESFMMGKSYLSKARLSKDLHAEGKAHLLSSFSIAQSCCFEQWTSMTCICLALQASIRYYQVFSKCTPVLTVLYNFNLAILKAALLFLGHWQPWCESIQIAHLCVLLHFPKSDSGFSFKQYN